MVIYALLLALLGVFSAQEAGVHPGVAPVGSWCFRPNYELPGQAAQPLGPRHGRAESRSGLMAFGPTPLNYKGSVATHQVHGLLSEEELPRGPFSFEAWIVDHVNRPVGVLAAAKARGATEGVDGPAWALGYHNDEVMFSLNGDRDTTLRSAVKPLAYKKYWYHVVGVYDGAEIRLYVNNKLFGGLPVDPSALRYPDDAQLEVTGYFGEEPFMQIGNVIHWAWLFPEAMQEDHVQARYDAFKYYIDEGLTEPGLFHFTVPPYLNQATEQGISIVAETDRPSRVSVLYGTEVPLTKEVQSIGSGRLHALRIDGLEPSAPYFYRVRAEAVGGSAGGAIDSGLLSFKTAVGKDEAFSFAIIGDTEARAHVNDRVSKLVWDERPDFVINCGDLTDGGREGHKFQWNHEYFGGMAQLHSRVPAFPVPGNGESDLYWYKRYHHLPEPEGFYSFSYGNADFFMLDSNQRDEEFREGGKQYEWLKERLAGSTATWKFVAHHHPVYTSDDDDYGDTWEGKTSDLGDLRVRPISALYEEFGVDAVFFGHLHTFERSWPIARGRVDPDRGVIYIQAGGAGGNLEDFAPTRTWFKHKTMRGHHYCTINIFGDTLEFRMHDLSGAMRDAFTLRKDDRGRVEVSR